MAEENISVTSEKDGDSETFNNAKVLVEEAGKITWEEQVERANKLRDESISSGRIVETEQTESSKASSADEITLEKVKDIARKTRSEEESGDASDDLKEIVKIGECVVSRESLGENKVLVDGVKERAKFDFLGRKRDKAKLEKILFGGANDMGVLKDNFTPTVANLFLEEFRKGPKSEFYSRASIMLTLVERLPISEQMNLISSDGVLERYSGDVLNMSNKTLSTKFAVVLANKLNQGEKVDLDFENICKAHIEGNLGASEDDNWAKETKDILSGVFISSGVSSKDVKLSCSSQEEICDSIEELVDDDTVFWMASKLGDVLQNNGKDESYERVFPESMRRFLAYNGGHETKLYSGATIGDFKNMEENSELLEQLDVDESFWLGAASSNRELVRRITDMESVDDGLKNGLQVFFRYPEMFRNVDNLEDLRNVDRFLLDSARESLEKGDILRAKDCLAVCCFGATTKDIIKDLISMGGIKTNKKERRDDISMTMRNKSGDDWDIRIGDFSKMLEIGKMNNDEYDMVLEAMAVIGASETTLKKIIERVNDDGSRSEDKKLIWSLERMKERFARNISREYGSRIRECIENGTEFVGDVEYDGKKINVLEMRGKELFLLTHVVGAFITKENIDDPGRWDNGRSIFSDSGVGYVSTSLVARGSLSMAMIERNGEVVDRPIYGFSDFGEDAIRTVHNTDAHVSVESSSDGGPKIVTKMPDYYESPDELSKNTNKDDFNEVVLNRYDKDGKRLRPNYLVVFTSDKGKIGGIVKKHAAYFGVPILMIDPKKYG